MLDPIKLNFSPFSSDSIAWSSDGELAVAGPDVVQLYIPKSLAHDPYAESGAATRDQWDTTRFRTNDFTQAELPEKEVVSFESSSIGEEQSAQYNSAVAWSPPGLSRHRRCAIGLLSTGHILSIWAARGNILDEDSWERVLVINNILAAHNVGDYQIEGVDAQDTEEIRQLRNRVRSFSWAHPLRVSPENPQRPGEDTIWLSKLREIILLTIANEYNEVILLQVSSACIGKALKQDLWTAKILLWESLAKPPAYVRLQGPKATLNRPWRFFRKLSISPWTSQDQDHCALLGYISNGNVRIRQLRIESVEGDQPLSELEPRLSRQELTPYAGELASNDWFDSIAWDDKIRYNCWTIAFSNADVVGIASIPTNLDFASLKRTVDLVELQSIEGVTVRLLPQSREERLSSMTFDKTQGPLDVRLHLSTSQYEVKSVIKIPITEGAEFEESSKWQTAIEDHQEEYDEEHRLAGNVLVKIHGLAASPIGGLLATCFSLHPSDRLDYLLPQRDTSMIIFDDERIDLPFWFPESALENQVPDEFEMSTELFSQTVQQVSNPSNDEDGSSEAITPSFASLKSLEARLLSFNQHQDTLVLKHSSTGTVKSDKTRVQQLSYVLKLLESKHPFAPTQKKTERVSDRSLNNFHLPQYLDFVLSYSFESVRSSIFSQKILYMAARIAAFGTVDYVPKKPAIKSAMLAFQWLSENSDMDLSEVIQVCRRNLQMEASEDQETYDGSGQEKLVYETCEICDAYIYLESFEEAKCLKGHSFVRCSLTYLAIQSPGISKYCRTCGKGYLNDSLLAMELRQSSRVTESQNSASSGDSTNEIEDEVILASFAQSPSHHSLTQQDGWHILRKKHASESQVREAPSLAEAVFTVFDTCPYCGGKFIS